MEITVQDGRLKILKEGRIKKFVEQVEEITFSGKYAKDKSQKVLYITERCVLELTEKGMTLIEIAPGIDLEKDILKQMEFEPMIDADLKVMGMRIFQESAMGLGDHFDSRQQ